MMFNTAMYQQPLVVHQLTEEQLRQHCAMRRDVDMNGMQVASHMQYHRNNRLPGKKHNQWSDHSKTNMRMLEYDRGLSHSQESLCVRPPSHESLSASSSEDLNDIANKGVKRLHELNGTHTQLVHAYTLNTPPLQAFQTRSIHGTHQGYQHHFKRRHPPNKNSSSSPTQLRRNKQPMNGSNYQVVTNRYMARSRQMEVRGTPRELVTGSHWDMLSTDVWKKFIANQQTSENYINKIKLFSSLYERIKMYLRYSVFVVGSTFNGFGTNSSDLDLCLVIRNQQLLLDLRADAIHHLINVFKMCTQLNVTGEYQTMDLIEAKVPLLKLHHSSGIDVDINCNNPVGIRNTHLLRCYAKADWRVQPLVLVVKLWAAAHQINDAKNMTISSYSLALMVIHFLQYGTKPSVLPCLQIDFAEKFQGDREIHEINMQETMSLPPSTNTQSLGELLLQFFQYYNDFNFVEDAISVRVGGTLPIDRCRRHPSPKNEPRAWSFLCIEEPFDHTNTARSVYDQDKFEHIRRVFQVSHQRLKETRCLDSIFLLKVTT